MSKKYVVINEKIKKKKIEDREKSKVQQSRLRSVGGVRGLEDDHGQPTTLEWWAGRWMLGRIATVHHSQRRHQARAMEACVMDWMSGCAVLLLRAIATRHR